MRKEYRWIENDREYFGQLGGRYDFKANDPKVAGRKIEDLNKLKEQIGKNVNPKAMDMLSTQEEQVLLSFIIVILFYIYPPERKPCEYFPHSLPTSSYFPVKTWSISYKLYIHINN